MGPGDDTDEENERRKRARTQEGEASSSHQGYQEKDYDMGESSGAKRAAEEEETKERKEKRRKKEDNDNQMANAVLAITADDKMAEWVARGWSPEAKEGRIGEMNFVDAPRIGGGGKGITKDIGHRARHIPGLMMDGGTIERIMNEKPTFWVSRVHEQTKREKMEDAGNQKRILHRQR